MSSSLLTKLRLKAGMKIRTIDAPADFAKVLDAKGAGITVDSGVEPFDQVHWFVKTKKEVDTGLPALRKLLHEGMLCWVYYPKGTSKIQTDLTRDRGWDQLLQEPALKWLSLVSFNDTWSAFSFRIQSNTDKKDKVVSKQRPIPDYIDPVKKVVKIPADLQEALDKDQKISAFFQNLAFSHKKEYVEWIVTAKKEETRLKRIEGTVTRLKQQWKNPRNK
jgi:bacteriocin resistance YdeI/OmpD-like protein